MSRVHGRNFLSLFVVVLACLSGLPGASGQEAAADAEAMVVQGQIAPRLQGLGDHHHPITTGSPRAQIFFDQGLKLAYGFNHAEAERSFREAVRLDPECAMCYWGQALVLGPNINMPMPPEAEPKAHGLIQKAIGLKPNVSEKERAYIEALAKRYSGEEKPDRQALDRAYAEAMRELHRRYPDDSDAATLYAEALMDLRPWNYWTRDGRPYPETLEIVSTLESVLERNPDHPGAIHYYIHAVEASNPDLAESPADRLSKLMPGAGHMVHMPSHIYVRVGRYADASASNERAIQADEDYITQCRAQGIYPLAYYPHNIHFLWMSSTLEGRSRVAIRAARKVAAKLTPEKVREMPLLNTFAVVPLYAYIRFGRWGEILDEPRPPADTLFWTGIWHYARGLALVNTGRADEAAKELDRLRALAAEESLEKLALLSPNRGASVIRIAAEVLAGELAAEQGDFEKAIAHLQRGVLLEDGLVYSEPPDWPIPVRQSLGAVLLEAGRAAEAETVYWEDLKRNRENGWSLFGLVQSLRAQGKQDEAARVEERFGKAWAQADITLAASRF